MTPEILKAINKAYNKSNKRKGRFFALIYKSTGLKRQAFDRGYLKDLIDTMIWNKEI